MDWVSRTNQKDDRRVKGKRTNGVVRTNQKDERRDEYQLKTVTEVRPSDGDQSESSPSTSRSDGGPGLLVLTKSCLRVTQPTVVCSLIGGLSAC